jgi:hypothetical protein
MTRTILFSMLWLAAFAGISQTNTLAWARSMGGSFGDFGQSVCVDNLGNVITTGSFNDTADFDPGPGLFTLSAVYNNPASTPYSDIFISKLDAAGNFVWARRFGDTLIDGGVAVTTDVTGNIYVTGNFIGSVDFDPGPAVATLTTNGWSNVFILKLDPAGNFVWAKSLNGSYAGGSTAIALDASGDVYISGCFNGTSIDMDPGPAALTFTGTGMATYISFFGRYTNQGNLVWAKQITEDTYCYAMKVDATGNVYLGGMFKRTPDFDPGPNTFTLNPTGGPQALAWPNAFIAKYDPSGNFLWVGQCEGFNPSIAFALAIDVAGNVYVTGRFNGAVDFDPGLNQYILTSATVNANTPSPFILKLNAAGNFVWVKQLVNVQSAAGGGLAVDASGDVYTTGFYTGMVDFDPGAGAANATSAGAIDVYLLKLSAAGNYVWMRSMGGAANDGPGPTIAVDASASIYLTGYYSSTADFDPPAATATLSAQGSEDVFVVKINQCFIPANPGDITPLNAKNICAGNTTTLGASSTGTISWHATASGPSLLGTGSTYTTPTLSAGTYSYYAEALTCTTSAMRTLITVTVSLCTGMEEQAQDQVLVDVYPNPSSGAVTISISRPLPGMKLLVFNATGSLIVERPVSSGTEQLDLDQQATGLYFICLSEGGKTIAVQKLIRQ